MATETKQLLEELKLIRTDLDYLKEHIVDFDLVLTEDDLQSLKEAELDLKQGKTKRLV